MRAKFLTSHPLTSQHIRSIILPTPHHFPRRPCPRPWTLRFSGLGTRSREWHNQNPTNSLSFRKPCPDSIPRVVPHFSSSPLNVLPIRTSALILNSMSLWNIFALVIKRRCPAQPKTLCYTQHNTPTRPSPSASAACYLQLATCNLKNRVLHFVRPPLAFRCPPPLLATCCF